jgi:hypothetical protein
MESPKKMCGDARGKGVLNERHFRDGIGDLHEFRRATSSGNHHMHERGTRSQRIEHRPKFYPAIDERVHCR